MQNLKNIDLIIVKNNLKNKIIELLNKDKELNNIKIMSLEELKQFSDVFEADVFEAISMETCVNKRLTIGAPGKEAMEKVIATEKAWLNA